MVVSNRETSGEEGGKRERARGGKGGGRGWKSAGGNDRHGYCKIYCSSSFRLVVIPGEERAIREAYETRGALSLVFHVNECTFFPRVPVPRERSLLSV